ncbi:hypothetical protein QBC38DRAFT_458866 [Podospora fimiseda]|uniref:Uncharacterized protein n=1 Tax=Podospora fimiseda TaxID=252190 RepID=A0AAN7GYY8_9PEZI|nr:hypothetical protein QBC38DRAFT_458866 [Podospora fimiseda]
MHLPTLLTAALAAAPLASAFKFTIYHQIHFTGGSRSWTSPGTYTIGSGGGKSWKFETLPRDRCCVRLCYQGREVGYRCQPDSNPNSSPIDKVVLGCGNIVLRCQA